MATNSLTATGLTVEAVTDITTDLTTGYKTIYGSDINLASETPDGQMINLYATTLEDNLQLLISVYNQFSLQNAVGVQVDNLIALNGLQRQPGTFTVTYVQITVTQALTLPGQDVLVANPNATVATVSNTAGNQYQLQTSYSFSGAGTATLAFIAVDIGQVLVSANTITTISTPLTGWSAANNPAFSTTLLGTVTNASASITGISSTAGITPGMLVTDTNGFFPTGTTVLSVNSTTQVTVSANATGGSPTTENITFATPATVTGNNEETDVQCKVRQGQSMQMAATGPADAIRAQLLNIPGLIDAFVPENDTASIVNNIAAYGIQVIVNPGTATPAQIAQAIYSKKTIGCAQTSSGTPQSFTITRPAGNTFTAYWYLAVTENLYVEFEILPINGSDTFNTTTIATQLAAYFTFKLNQSVNIGNIIAAMLTIAPNAYLTNVNVSTDNATWVNSVTPSDYKHYFTLAASNITVTT